MVTRLSCADQSGNEGSFVTIPRTWHIKNILIVFREFAKSLTAVVSFVVSACISSTPTGETFLKLDIGDY